MTSVCIVAGSFMLAQPRPHACVVFPTIAELNVVSLAWDLLMVKVISQSSSVAIDYNATVRNAKSYVGPTPEKSTMTQSYRYSVTLRQSRQGSL